MEIRTARPSDKRAVVATLAKAFHDDPVKCHLTKLDSVPVWRSALLFDALYDMQMRHGEVLMTSTGDAAAMWARPGEWKVPTSVVLGSALDLLRVYRWRVVHTLRYLNTVEKLHPAEPHAYLEFVGVDPAAQGKGLGVAIMEAKLDQLDAESVPAYLENSKERNLGFYHRFGFEVRGTVTPFKGGPTVWLMWRETRRP